MSDLLVKECAHCRPKPPPARRERSGLGPWIAAAYRGECAGCGGRIDEGERIRSDGAGGWLAQCCGEVDDDPLDGVKQMLAVAGLLESEPHFRDPSDDERPARTVPAGPPAATYPQLVESLFAVQPTDQAATYAAYAAQPCMICKGEGNCQFCETLPAPTGSALVQATAAELAALDAANPVKQLATTIPAGPPASTVAEMREVLTALDAARPRSLQKTLGPSELGTPCQRQIAYKLAGVPRQPEDKRPPWAPMQGTAMHTLMEEALHFHNQQLGRERWIVEETLVIDPGVPGCDPITGHGDAFDTDSGTVVDWKYVGVTALREVKRKTIANDQLVKPDYRVQAHLYGRGHERAGRDVRYVRLVFLARSHDYADSAEWTEPYQPEIAEQAILRYYATHDLLAALNPAANPALWAVVPAAPGKACSWCPFRRVGGPADGSGCPGDLDDKIDKQMHGLIA